MEHCPSQRPLLAFFILYGTVFFSLFFHHGKYQSEREYSAVSTRSKVYFVPLTLVADYYADRLFVFTSINHLSLNRMTGW